MSDIKTPADTMWKLSRHQRIVAAVLQGIFDIEEICIMTGSTPESVCRVMMKPVFARSVTNLDWLGGMVFSAPMDKKELCHICMQKQATVPCVPCQVRKDLKLYPIGTETLKKLRLDAKKLWDSGKEVKLLKFHRQHFGKEGVQDEFRG